MNAQEEIKRAAAEWPLSLRDDPTAFGPGDTWSSVTDKANQAIKENARSAISRGLGKIVDDVAMACDVELEENGGLADLDSVIARFAPGLEVDTVPIHEATDWTARVNAIRQCFALAVAGLPVSTVDGKQLREFVAGEPRLAHLTAAKPVAAKPVADGLDIPAALDRRKPKFELPPGVSKDYDFTPSGRVQVPATEESDGWDDEPAGTATPAPVEPARDETSRLAELAELVSDLGVKDVDFAAALGISRTYLSLMRKGERPWQPLKSDRAEAVMAIVNAKLAAGIRAGEILKGV